jgi:hypothetical protein
MATTNATVVRMSGTDFSRISAPMPSCMPLGRFIESESEVVLFLSSDRASMIDGISTPVDFGFKVT